MQSCFDFANNITSCCKSWWRRILGNRNIVSSLWPFFKKMDWKRVVSPCFKNYPGLVKRCQLLITQPVTSRFDVHHLVDVATVASCNSLWVCKTTYCRCSHTPPPWDQAIHWGSSPKGQNAGNGFSLNVIAYSGWQLLSLCFQKISKGREREKMVAVMAAFNLW